MIYVDTSVLLAQLLSEDRVPPPAIWSEPLVASRLVEYEMWVTLHRRRLSTSHGELAQQLLGRVSLVELAPPVLSRALEPFPRIVRTLDALHLATAVFLAERGQTLDFATYDAELAAVAKAIGIRLASL